MSMRASGFFVHGGRMSRRVFLAALAAAVLAAAPVLAATVRFTVIGIDCEACAPPIVKALRGVSGVADAKSIGRRALPRWKFPKGSIAPS